MAEYSVPVKLASPVFDKVDDEPNKCFCSKIEVCMKHTHSGLELLGVRSKTTANISVRYMKGEDIHTLESVTNRNNTVMMRATGLIEDRKIKFTGRFNLTDPNQLQDSFMSHDGLFVYLDLSTIVYSVGNAEATPVTYCAFTSFIVYGKDIDRDKILSIPGYVGTVPNDNVLQATVKFEKVSVNYHIQEISIEIPEREYRDISYEMRRTPLHDDLTLDLSLF
jgi:hypothetical protein